jgi:hypothetical protein
MESDLTLAGPGIATVTLRVRHAARIDMGCARDAFDDVSWLGRPVDPPAGYAQGRRVAADLELPVFDGSGLRSVRKSALIDLGPSRYVNGSILVQIGWRSDSLSPLFPVFAGHLRVQAERLVLEGRYAPPFGKLGLLMDAALLHLVAARTAKAFLSRVAARCPASGAADV